MERKTIRRAGSIATFPFFSDGAGMRVTKQFLDHFIAGFVRQSEKYMTITGEAPFAFRERQLHSIMAPALSQCTDLILMEAPVERKWSDTVLEQNNSHGWVDYWCYLRNVVLLIELKHGYCSLRSNNASKKLQSDWAKAIEQLNAIKQEALIQSEWSKGSVRIAFHVIPIYETITKRKSVYENDIEQLLVTADRIVNRKGGQTQWIFSSNC